MPFSSQFRSLPHFAPFLTPLDSSRPVLISFLLLLLLHPLPQETLISLFSIPPAPFSSPILPPPSSSSLLLLHHLLLLLKLLFLFLFLHHHLLLVLLLLLFL